MYGLLLESFSNYIKLRWGEERWEAVRRHAEIETPTFCIHQIYGETLIPKLTKSAVQVLGVEERELFEVMGVYFVDFIGQFGYDQVMSVLGRHMRDFLNGLDNLHEYLKFSYPRMRAPSFFCDCETADGMILHYRSKRRGFVYYTMGQIKQVAKRFYETECDIDVLNEELEVGGSIHVTFGLKFDNRAFIRDKTKSQLTLYREEKLLPFRTSKLFELFPFCIVFDHDMIIRQSGYSLRMIWNDLVGLHVTEAFEIVRPMIPVTFSSILERQNNSFELMTNAPINNEIGLALGSEDTGAHLRLRGQMLYMEDWKSIMFLATPVVQDLDSLLSAGLYINDLSLHDCSRDFVLAGTQQSVELKLALHQEQLKTRKLEDSMRKLDDEMKRTDELLYQMIPKQVADRIRRGENPVDTCEVFDAVSILFSDVVTFTEICSRITPMLVVSMLNHMYSLFDQLTERNKVYKVETIGDSYMVVSGAPNQETNHAEKICDMAMDMIDASKGIFDPSRGEEHLKLRVGVHSGNVVAGVVGLKMPRYCLFGDTVNTSSRMESTSESGKIQISQTTHRLLPAQYETCYRGEVQMKGKGKMKTYWLISRVGRIPLSQLECSTITWTAPTMDVYSSTNVAEPNRKANKMEGVDNTWKDFTPADTPNKILWRKFGRKNSRLNISSALKNVKSLSYLFLHKNQDRLDNKDLSVEVTTADVVSLSSLKNANLSTVSKNIVHGDMFKEISPNLSHVQQIPGLEFTEIIQKQTSTPLKYENCLKSECGENITCLKPTNYVHPNSSDLICSDSLKKDFVNTSEANLTRPITSSILEHQFEKVDCMKSKDVQMTNVKSSELSKLDVIKSPSTANYYSQKFEIPLLTKPIHRNKVTLSTVGVFAEQGCSAIQKSSLNDVMSQTCNLL